MSDHASLTQALALEESSESSLSSVTALVLRGLSLSSLPRSSACGLRSLSSLSLSHNSFSDLTNFDQLTALTDLNLNFNAVTSPSLKFLSSLPRLKALYLSNNSLDDAAFSTLSSPSSFPSLEVLSVFKNNLASLEGAMTACCKLERLRDFTADGNELAGRKVRGGEGGKEVGKIIGASFLYSYSPSSCLLYNIGTHSNSSLPPRRSLVRASPLPLLVFKQLVQNHLDRLSSYLPSFCLIIFCRVTAAR